MAKQKPKAKHHEVQALANVEVVRGRVLRLMRNSLGNVRSLLSTMAGNEHVVERLRGKPGDELLGRVAEYVMTELGDNSTASEGGVSRAIARKVRGSMGLGTEEQNDEVEPQTA